MLVNEAAIFFTKPCSTEHEPAQALKRFGFHFAHHPFFRYVFA
jgi:hypothetical protein